MTENTFDKNKKYQTREGNPWRFYADDGAGAYPIHGAWLRGSQWISGVWGKNCMYSAERAVDLVEAKPTHTIWVNLYKDGAHGEVRAYAYPTRELADRYWAQIEPRRARLACIELTFHAGDGLDV